MATPAEQARLIENLRLTFALHEAGVDMKRQSLRRSFPDETPERIEARLLAWMHERPGAELGDGVGVPVSWPLPRR